LNFDTLRVVAMSLEIEHECPRCGGTETFYRSASTTLHLGEKTKWRCTECDFGIVRIDGDIDSSAAA
jgi:hypothetical protein